VRTWTHFWSAEAVAASTAIATSMFDHSASNQFRDRGVAPGDAVFGISYVDGDLHVIGRLTVDKIVDQATAEHLLPYEPWMAADHVISAPQTCTAMHYDRIIGGAQMGQISFVLASGGVGGVKHRRDGKVEPQSFRGVREITPGTARLFESVLATP
jgi:hypothetical protein